MRENALKRVAGFGQGIWMDFMSRSRLVSGEFASMIQEEGVSGVSYHAAGFEGAVSGGADYDRAIRELSSRGVPPAEIFLTLAVEDARLAADLLRPLYERTDARDGFSTLELPPSGTRTPAATLQEARSLWQRVDRPNFLVGVPAAGEGTLALRRLVREGVNVRATGVLGVDRYRAAGEAYLDGLAERAARGLPLERLISLASFPVAAMERLVDARLYRQLREEPGRQGVVPLIGEVALALAKVSRKVYRETLAEDRYLALAARGARPQRILWELGEAGGRPEAGVRYLEALIGPDTVVAARPETLALYRDSGSPSPRLDQGVNEALAALERLSDAGIDLAEVGRDMEEEYLSEALLCYGKLMRGIELKSRAP